MARRVLLASAAMILATGVACSSFSGDDPEPASPDAGEAGAEPADGGVPPDASRPDAACDPKAPFGAQTSLVSLNDTSQEANARLTPDELTIYFASNRYLQNDLFVAGRKTRTEPFSTPQGIAGVNSLSHDAQPWISADNLRLLFSSQRDDNGQWDIFETRRPTLAAPFDPPHVLSGVGVPGVIEYEPFMDEARAELYFASNRDTDAGTPHVRRAALFPDGGIGPVADVDLGVDAGDSAENPVVSFDGLALYVMSRRAPASDFDISVSTRPSVDAPWGALVPVTELNSKANDSPSWISPDHCRIYFASDRLGSYDLYVAERAR